MGMTPRQRFQLAVNHKEPDHVPIDLGGSTVTSLHVATYTAVREYLHLPDESVAIIDPIQQLPLVSEDFATRLRSDVRFVYPPTAGKVDIYDDGDCYAFVDRFGSKLNMPKEGGLYYDWVAFPISAATDDALDAYAWPNPDPPEVIHAMRSTAKTLWETTDYAVVTGLDIVRGVLEEPTHLMGFEAFYQTLLTDRVFADRLMGKLTDLYVECCQQFLSEVGPYIDAFLFMDDIAGQDGWLINPELYRSVVKPKQQRVFDIVHRASNAKILYHGCGASFELIGDLIDIGVELFNPVQVSARGMDSARLKQTYGRDIVFWGGGVDTQKVLPFASPDAVRDEVRRRIDDFAPGGGFVFAAVHNVQAFVPPENVLAAFDEAFEHGRYRTTSP